MNGIEYMGFLESLFTSLLGIGIVFACLVFLAIYVTVVSKVIGVLEKNITVKEETQKTSAKVVSTTSGKNVQEAKNIAVITAAICEERKESVDKFVIKNIQKI